VNEPSQKERRAACRASGRAVAAALLGFTLQYVSIRPLEDSPHFNGVAALAEATARRCLGLKFWLFPPLSRSDDRDG